MKSKSHAREGVRHMCLVDALKKVLNTYRLEAGRWVQQATYTGHASVRAEPFEAVELELCALWVR